MNLKSFPVIAALTIVLSAGCAQAPPDSFDEAFAAVDRMVLSSMEENGTPGLALAVTTGDRLLHTGAYGYADLKSRVPVTDETLFQIGSISKSFTALALMHLYDEGAFDPQRPMVEYLPWFRVQSDFAPITAHHLLSHTAGIPANRDDIFGSPYMALALREQATAWPPGERFYYSNVGYQTLHVLTEELAGERYASLVGRLILEPLDMTHTTAAITLDSRARQAVGYIPAYDDRPAHRSRALTEAPYHEYGIGDGSIQSTAADMAAYVRMLLNRGQGPRSRLVSEEAFDLFVGPHIRLTPDEDSPGYGYGIFSVTRDGHRLLQHSGGMVGFSAFIAADLSDDVGIVVLVNGPADFEQITAYISSALQAAKRGEPAPPAPERKDPTLVENPAEFAGVYTCGPERDLVFESDSPRLLIRNGDEEIVLENRGKDSFYTPHPEFDRYALTFARDESGSVVEVSYGPLWCTNERYDGPTRFEEPAEWASFTGRYRSYSPWFPYFEVITRKGRLLVVTGEGGESTSAATVLVPLAGGGYRPGEEINPEVLRFEDVVDGQALQAVWSGHPFYRISW